MSARLIRTALLAAVCTLSIAGTAVAADQTVTGNQWVIGKSCIGTSCIDTVVPTMSLDLKHSDTPGVRLAQDNTGGFAAQTWDVAGNEANYFVRDVTSGSKLPFRIRPNTVTSTLDLRDGFVTSVGQFVLYGDGTTVTPFSTSDVTTKLANVGFETYTSSGSTATQYRPVRADLNTQFGEPSDKLNPSTVATLALAGAKENSAGLKALIARVDAIPGDATITPLTNRVKKLETANAKLKKQYKSLSKSLSSLKKQVRKLARSR